MKAAVAQMTPRRLSLSGTVFLISCRDLMLRHSIIADLEASARYQGGRSPEELEVKKKRYWDLNIFWPFLSSHCVLTGLSGAMWTIQCVWKRPAIRVGDVMYVKHIESCNKMCLHCDIFYVLVKCECYIYQIHPKQSLLVFLCCCNYQLLWLHAGDDRFAGGPIRCMGDRRLRSLHECSAVRM